MKSTPAHVVPPAPDEGHYRGSERYSEMVHLRGPDATPVVEPSPLRLPRPPGPTMKLRWDEPSIAWTGPYTYRVVVPIDLPISDEEAVFELTEQIERRWSTADRGPGGLRVAAVRGFIETPAPDRAQLTLLVATTGGSDQYSDRSHLGKLVAGEAARDRRRRRTVRARTPRRV